MSENSHNFIPHKKYCIHNKENLSTKEKLNPDILLTNLRCALCNEICLINIDKENYNYSLQCTRCTPEKISELDESINNYNKLRNKLIKSEYYTKSDFYCTKHCDNIFHSFCRKCNLNICERCLNRHHNHEKIELNKLILDQRDVFINKIKMRKQKEMYDKIIENIVKTKNEIDNEINGLINMIRNIYSLEEYVIKNYNINNQNKNYFYLENFKNIINNLDINFPLSNEFINESNFETRVRALIDSIIIFKNSHKDENNESINDISYYSNNLSKKNAISNKTGKTINFVKINKKNNLINSQRQKDKFKREINVLNISLDDTMQKNEELEGYKKIGNEFVKFIKIPEKENYEIKISNKDNNRESASINNVINNNVSENNYYLLEENKGEREQINPQMKFLENTNNVIKSLEFIDKNHILICDSSNISFYLINTEINNLSLIYSMKKEEEENNFTYAKILSNGNIIICSTYDITIIKLQKSNSKIINHSIIQKISNKGFNINKIIEIPNKQSIISCDKENLKKFKKDSNSLYNQVNIAKIDTEVKCIEYVNDDVFVAVMPENDEIVFYDVDAMHSNKYVVGKIYTIHGRYVINNSEKFGCIFFASTIGVYIFSNKNYKLFSIYKLDDWITAINFDTDNDLLICAGVNKYDVHNKNVSLTIFSVTKNKFEDFSKSNIKLLIKKRIDNICKEDIIAINCLENQILFGSNDKTMQLYNY